MTIVTAILALAIAIAVLVTFFAPKNSKKDGSQRAPGPKVWPIIGNLAYIGKFRDINEAFLNLKAEYGNIASIKLGVFNAVVISGWKNFREVLVNNAHIFEARPGFARYDFIFGGSRDNSLAFANGSETHQAHRATLANHTFMKPGSCSWENFEAATTESLYNFMEELKPQVKVNNKVDIKLQIAEAVATSFVKFFCNVDVDRNDDTFKNMVNSFDSIFQEINEGHIGDVLPVFMRLWNKNEYIDHSTVIREFVHQQIVLKSKRQLTEMMETVDENNNNGKDNEEYDRENNLWNSLLDAVENKEMTFAKAIYSFEDLLGGHSAVSNSMIRLIHQIASHPEVQQKIRDEVNQSASGFPNISDRLTYTEAAIWEGLRFISSPIVPHVATEDTSIEDYIVKKGTIVMFNNSEMNFSPDLWEEPEKFMPERFINEEGFIRKPEYFLPFSTGRRSCLGYKLLISNAKATIANLCQSYNIELDPLSKYDFPRGVIACGRNISHPFVFHPLD